MSESPITPDGMADAIAMSSVDAPETSLVTPSSPHPAPIEAAPLSLPPAAQDPDTAPSSASNTLVMEKRDRGSGKKRKPWKLAKDSVVRKKALAIIAMRANGYSNDQISKELNIGVDSIRQYLYRAAKAGFFVGKKGYLVDPHDRLEFDLTTKAVDNLEEMLSSDRVLSRGEKSVKMEATLALANGVLFKKFDQPKETAMPTNILQINIQGGTDTAVDVLEGGAPLYVDGEVLETKS